MVGVAGAAEIPAAKRHCAGAGAAAPGAAPAAADPADDGEEATRVAPLRRVFDSGVTRSLEWRRETMDLIAQMLRAGCAEITAAQEADGVPKPQFEGALKRILEVLEFYKQHVGEWMAERRLPDSTPVEQEFGVEMEWSVQPQAKGVGLNIAPWNAPVTLSILPTLGLIAAGNVVIIKPSEVTLHTSRLFQRLCAKYLRDRVHVVFGGPAVVNRVIDEGVDHIVFTGGASIASFILARAAKSCTPCTLELGGKSPAFVDAGLTPEHLHAAVKEIVGTKVYSRGEFCCCPDYVLCHESAYDAFVARVEETLAALGPRRRVRIIHRNHFLRVRKMLDTHHGRNVPPVDAASAPDEEALLLPLTAVAEPRLDDFIMQDEVFGPLLAVLKVPDVGAAVRIVNTRPTGKPLIAYVFSSDRAAQDAFIAATSSGNIVVNGGPQRAHGNLNTGFGGIGNSGTGRAMWGRAAFDEFSNLRNVCRTADSTQCSVSSWARGDLAALR